MHPVSARNKERGEDRLAAEVNDARAMKGGGGGSGGGGEHRMRETARSLATVLRIKVQLTGGKKKTKTIQERKNVKFLQQNSPRPEIKRLPPSCCCAPLFTKSSPLVFLGMNENARLGAIKRGSPGHRRLRSPLSLRSLHSSLRNHFGPSLGCQTRENWEVGVGALGGKAWTTRRTGTPPLSEGS